MIVAGVMSGTSADGIDVAFVRFTDPERLTSRRRVRSGRQHSTSVPLRASANRAASPYKRSEFLGHVALPYPADVRRRILASMNSRDASVADLARLNFLLGELYAEAVLAAQKRLRIKAELIGCHGQTLYHQGSPAPFLGRKLAVSWQTGEASVIAARTRVPVVSDFRPADMAAGGKGAPLVPFLDYLLYRDSRVGRIALNIGGIANLTAIPANAPLDQVIAFDTGPGNMVIDALADQLFGQACDRDGKIAASGQVLDVITHFLRQSFFGQKPPKSAGREEFGRDFAREFLRKCLVASHRLVGGGRRRASAPTRSSSKGAAHVAQKRDAIATATALTVLSIAHALSNFILPKGRFAEVVASGGGTRNPTLMAWLAKELNGVGLHLRSSDEFGVPSEAKEAVAFAMLGFETWNHRPSNVPSATGAKRAAVLGKISFP